MTDRYIRRTEVIEMTGVSISTIRRWENAGIFPARRQLGPARIAWVESEVLSWMDTRAIVEPDQVAA